MNEYEIKKEYKDLLKNTKSSTNSLTYVDKIEKIKVSLTPKQYLDLQGLLVNAFNHEHNFRNIILKRLDKKIDEFSLKNIAGTEDEIKKLDFDIKISRSTSIRRLRLKPKKFQTRNTQKLRKYRKTMKKLSPIVEETENSESPENKTKSTGGRRKLRKTMRTSRST